MSKKKSTSKAIDSLMNFSQGLPNIDKSISQIPNYEDTGVSYKGYSKTLLNGEQYRINKQETRFLSCYIPAGSAAGNYSFSRANYTKTFYCTSIQIDYSSNVSPTTIIIYDQEAANPKYKAVMADTEQHINVVINDTPRKFSGTSILINIDSDILLIGGFLHVELFGWEE